MQGTLLRYGPANEHLAFLSAGGPRHVLLIAGLTEGLLGCSYAPQLAAELQAIGWTLVQVQVGAYSQGACPISRPQHVDPSIHT